MTGVCRAIFKAIHAGKWLTVEYKNQDAGITRYWISIKDIRPRTKQLVVDGLHLRSLSICELKIYVDSIQSAAIIDGSYYPVNKQLVEDIRLNPDLYAALFSNVANLRILNYLADCNKLDATPYQTEYSLIERLDEDRFSDGEYALDAKQFAEIVAHFQMRSRGKSNQLRMKQLAINLLSIDTKQGLYVLAYKRLRLDVVNRSMRADEDIVLCKEFTVNGTKQSIYQFLSAEDYDLLEDVCENLELLKNRITAYAQNISGVNDMPYILAIGMDHLIDLDAEYAGILDLYNSPDGENVTAPIQAFFGDLTKRPIRRKTYPLALLNQRVNLDQLLAINNAMKYPLTYVQGPPGTGKTNTIINTLTTAFFNERTVLFASYNNHPIDSVCDALQNIRYNGQIIPFPMIRLGSNEKTEQALQWMRRLYEQTKDMTVYDATLERDRDDKIHRTEQLTDLLRRYDEIRDLNERKETIERLLESRTHMSFQYKLQAGQLPAIKARLAALGEIHADDALPLIDRDTGAFLKYLFYTSAKHVKRLDEPKNKELLAILYAADNERVAKFNRYLTEEENLHQFLRIFPLVATTCISAHRLGKPAPAFDMVIMDEASQCNTAVSLVPILRGNSLMLVGDPQQLNPVIVLDPATNATLRKKYNISSEYDYIENSIYKTFLACDAVSDEVLLRYHYRCHPSIIGFNNRKYYNNKLQIESKVDCAQPLVFVDVPDDSTESKNTAPCEAERIAAYIRRNPAKKIGVITPFASQRAYINSLLGTDAVQKDICGTVHAFQGDEKDVIVFSLALTDQTKEATYNWLKNNKELINVATSRARDQLIIVSSSKNIERLHNTEENDDLYELVQYVRTNGLSKVSPKTTASRALGIKPYSTKTETAFLENLNHALDNAFTSEHRCVVHKEVGIAHVFQDNPSYNDLFYSGRFDFVVYEKIGKEEVPILAIELDGKEHIEDAVVQERDRKKEAICREHGFELIRVENSYA
ncbi:MAG: AAA domain-containing protein, partial [Ruthenibacterium sp.]